MNNIKKTIVTLLIILFEMNLYGQIKHENQIVNDDNFDASLVKLIRSINYADQKYRKQDYKKNLAKQNKLDNLNLSKIDSLYKKYHTYIGITLVGDDLNHVMWLVIQHSSLKKWKNIYL